MAITDIVTGLFGAVGILAALRSGVGQRIDVSLLESTLATLINQAQNAFVNGSRPNDCGNAHPNIVPYETFATSDGEIAVAVGSERQWPRLCHALGLDHLATDARFADNDSRVRNRAELRPLLANRFASEPSRALAGGARCGASAQWTGQQRPRCVRAAPGSSARHGSGRGASAAGIDPPDGPPVQAVRDPSLDSIRAATPRRKRGRDSRASSDTTRIRSKGCAPTA